MEDYGKMTEIDGSTGGGQVLRSAVALSALTLEPIRIYNIRKSRPNPGLAAQHLAGVKAAADYCDAEVKGLKIGSQEIEFIPKKIDIPPYKKIDIGTAGSIGLLLQTITPLMIYTTEPATIEITGGTDVMWAPTTSYFQHVFCDFLKGMGTDIHIKTLVYGFYPKGGGRVRVTYNPMGKQKLGPLGLTERGKLERIDVWSIASNSLKDAKVAERQIDGFKKNLKRELLNKIENVNTIYSKTLSPGTSIHTHAHYKNCKIGAGSLGKRGKPAETVGKHATDGLLQSMSSEAALDKYMADQIIPFIALADGRSEVKVEKITEHVETNIGVVEKLLPVKFEIKENVISVKGVSYRAKLLR